MPPWSSIVTCVRSLEGDMKNKLAESKMPPGRSIVICVSLQEGDMKNTLTGLKIATIPIDYDMRELTRRWKMPPCRRVGKCHHADRSIDRLIDPSIRLIDHDHGPCTGIWDIGPAGLCGSMSQAI